MNAFEKIKERLEERAEKSEISRRWMLRTEGDSKDYCYFNGMVEGFIEAQRIVSEAEVECVTNPVYQYAVMYATNLVLYGVDITDKLDSATEQSYALHQAYIRGVSDERKRIYEAEYGNGWIPCSERLPEKATVYEVTEEIIICSQKQYIVEHRLFGTEGEWLCPSNRKVIAWMPLPEPYKPEKGEK